MKKIYNIIPYAIIILLILFVFKQCQEEPETITTIEYITKTDTITNTVIKEIPTVKYVTKIKTEKGKDSIVYIKDTTDIATPIIKANEYKASLKSNNATAALDILTTGELLDVKGTITYKEKQTTITTFKDRSVLYGYAEASVKPVFERVEVGLDYTIKNKWIVGTSVSYNNVSNTGNINVKVGIKIF